MDKEVIDFDALKSRAMADGNWAAAIKFVYFYHKNIMSLYRSYRGSINYGFGGTPDYGRKKYRSYPPPKWKNAGFYFDYQGDDAYLFIENYKGKLVELLKINESHVFIGTYFKFHFGVGLNLVKTENIEDGSVVFFNNFNPIEPAVVIKKSKLLSL